MAEKQERMKRHPTPPPPRPTPLQKKKEGKATIMSYAENYFHLSRK